MTLEDFRALAVSLPGVEEGIAYGTPIWRAGKRMLTRVWEGEDVVLKIGIAQREALIASQPEVYFVTDHHRGFSLGLAHLSQADPQEIEAILREGWRSIAPKRLLRERAEARTHED